MTAQKKWDYDWKVKKEYTIERRIGRSLYFSQLAEVPGETVKKILGLMQSDPGRFKEEVRHDHGYGRSEYDVTDLVNGFRFKITTKNHSFMTCDGFLDHFHTARADIDSIVWATPAELLQLAMGAHKMVSRKNNEKAILAAEKRKAEIAEGRRKTIELYNEEGK